MDYSVVTNRLTIDLLEQLEESFKCQNLILFTEREEMFDSMIFYSAILYVC